MNKRRSRNMGRIFSVICATGFSIVLLLNVVASFVLGKPESIYFSSDWWSQWFPAYIVWLAFLILAVIFRANDKSCVD